MAERKRLNALETALFNEEQERVFYLKQAERTRNELGKAMFKQIADEELEHYERLMELQEKWKKDEKWPETVPLTVKGTKVKDVLRGMIDSVEKMAPGDDDDLKALQKAINFEADGAIYYARLRDQVTDPREKAFFNLLADMEHEHYVSLKDTEELMRDPASWFRVKERHTLDG